MTAHTIRRESGGWTFGGATLRTRGGTIRRGTLHTAAGDFELEPADPRRLGVTARIDGRPVVALQPGGCRIPGPGGPAQWSPGHHSATLTRGDARIEVCSGWGGSLRVEVTGAWAEEELVVLTVCFAVLSRRRQRLIVMAVATSAARGPV